jgi:hypothetical protein
MIDGGLSDMRLTLLKGRVRRVNRRLRGSFGGRRQDRTASDSAVIMIEVVMRFCVQTFILNGMRYAICGERSANQ